MNALKVGFLSKITAAAVALLLSASANGELLTNLRIVSCDDGPAGATELTSQSGLSDSGHVIGHASFSGGGSGAAIASPGGLLTEVARIGDGFAGGTATRFDALRIDSSGTRVGMLAKLDGIPNFPFADAILTGPVGGGGAFVWEGGTAPGVTPSLTISTIDSFRMNGSGELAYRVNNQLLYIDDVPVIEQGVAYPGVAGVGKYSFISSGLLFNNERSILFKGALLPQGGVTNSDNDGVFLRQGGGQFIEVAREGMPAAGVGGATYSSSVEPISLSDGGKLAVSGGVAGPGFDSTNNGCVWVGEGANLTLLARAGESVSLPGGESAPFRFRAGSRCGVAANGNALLFGSLDTNAANVTFETGNAIWYWDGSSLVPLLRQGQAVPGASTRTISSIETSFISPDGSAVIATRLSEPTGGGFVTIHEVIWATDPGGSNLRIVIDTDDEFDRGGGDIVRQVRAASLGALSSGFVFNRGRINAENEVIIDLDLHNGFASTIHCSAVMDLGGSVEPGTGAISGNVREDLNRDGVFSAGDIGFTDVTLQLFVGDEVSASSPVGIDGSYEFQNVPPGDYVVVGTFGQAALDAGYVFTDPVLGELAVTVIIDGASADNDFLCRPRLPTVSVEGLVAGLSLLDLGDGFGQLKPKANAVDLRGANALVPGGGLVADGMTPLIVRLRVTDQPLQQELRWECQVISGGTVNGGIVERMSAFDHNSDSWQPAVPAGPNFLETDTRSGVFGDAYVSIGALLPTDLGPGPETKLEFKVFQVSTGELLITSEIIARRPPVFLVSSDATDKWGQDFKDALAASRGADFVKALTFDSDAVEKESGYDEFYKPALVLENLAWQETVNEIRERWAMTYPDVIGHGKGGFLVLGLALEDEDGDSSFFMTSGNFYRGRYRRAVNIGTPHRNSASGLARYIGAVHSYLYRNPENVSFFPRFPETFDRLISRSIGNNTRSATGRNQVRFEEGNDPQRYDSSARIHLMATRVDTTNSDFLSLLGFGPRAQAGLAPGGIDGWVEVNNALASPIPSLDDRQRTLLLQPFLAYNRTTSGLGGAKAQIDSPAAASAAIDVLDNGDDGAFFSGQEFQDFDPQFSEYENHLYTRAQGFVEEEIFSEMTTILELLGGRAPRGNDTTKTFEIAPLVGQGIVDGPYWFAEVHGPDGVTGEGVTVTPDGQNIHRVSVSIESGVIGDVVLFASYRGAGGTVIAEPILVDSCDPNGATATTLTLRPDGILMNLGRQLLPAVVVHFDDGSSIQRWLRREDFTVISSDPNVIDVSDKMQWSAVGEGTVTITLNHAGLTAESTLTIVDPHPPLTYGDWKAQHFTQAELADSNVSGDGADSDGDSLSTFIEYITGGDPQVASPGHLPGIREVDFGTGTTPVYAVRIATQLIDDVAVVQRSSDLKTWIEVAQDGPALVGDFDLGGYRELWFDFGASDDRAFYRLAVNPPDPNGEVVGTTELRFQFYVPNTDYGDRIDDTNFDPNRYGGESPYTPNVMVDLPGNTNRASFGFGDLDENLFSPLGPLIVELAADPGHVVRLESFDLAGRSSDRIVGSIEIKDVDGTVIWSANDFVAPGTGHAHFDFPGLVVQSSIVRIHINGVVGGDDKVGIDNIRFHQVVPADLGNWSMLTFETGVGDRGRIGQDYGDRITGPGNFGARYLGGGGFTPGIVADYLPDRAARQYQDDFGDLEFAIASPITTEPHDVVLTADPGSLVQLHGFDLGSFARSSRLVGLVEVLDASGNSLFSESNVDIVGSRKRFDFSAAPLESQAITIRYDATNLGADVIRVGLSHIVFSEISDDSGGGGEADGATVFTFNDFIFVNYGDRVDAPITEGVAYGGEPFYTPNIEAFFPLSPSPWVSGYGDLTDVIYASSGVLQIDLVADFGHEIRLESFDLAGFGADRLVGLIEIVDGEGLVLWSGQNVIAPGTGHASLDFTALGIESNIVSVRVDATNLGGSSDEVGIDNLRFQQLDKVELGDWSMMTFDTGQSSGELVSQFYGDRIGSVQNGFGSYYGGGAFTPGIVAEYVPGGAGYHWVNGFGDLKNVLYKDDAIGTPFEVRLIADAGQNVRLFGFDMGAISSLPPLLNLVEVLDESGNVLFSESNAEISTVRTRYDFSLSPLEADEIVIRYDATNLGGQSDDVGIDNITFGQFPD